MSADPIVYRSEWPEVIDAYEAGMAERQEWDARIRAFVDEHGGGRPAMTVRGFSGEHFVGFEPAEGDRSQPPTGWRVDTHGVLVPDKRRKAGKELAEAIKTLGVRSKPDLPGMPTESFAGDRFLSPGIERHEDTVYVRWTAEPDPPPSTDAWERCPLSEYYAAVEAKS